MSSDDYHVQNIYRYSRKTYKSLRNEQDNEWNGSGYETVNNEVAESSPRCDDHTVFNTDPRSCHCDVDPEGEITSILHKKCPVISLAQQQLQRLLDETDKLLCDNTRCCRSVYDFISLCKEIILNQNKCQCVLLVFMLLAFIIGIILGAASCGTYLGRFNSPILTCIDNKFMPDTYRNIEDKYRSII